MSAEVIQLNSNTFNTPIVSEHDAEKELLDYMIWTMKHEQDPHDLYDDPIEVFRKEIKADVNVAC